MERRSERLREGRNLYEGKETEGKKDTIDEGKVNSVLVWFSFLIHFYRHAYHIYFCFLSSLLSYFRFISSFFTLSFILFLFVVHFNFASVIPLLLHTHVSYSLSFLFSTSSSFSCSSLSFSPSLHLDTLPFFPQSTSSFSSLYKFHLISSLTIYSSEEALENI